jgi:Protein of unknown function (DUF3102)
VTKKLVLAACDGEAIRPTGDTAPRALRLKIGSDGPSGTKERWVNVQLRQSTITDAVQCAAMPVPGAPPPVPGTPKTTSRLECSATLAEHAAEIRKLHKKWASDVVEIGRRLTDAKAQCGHGKWLPWLKDEFNWSNQQARRFMHVYEFSKNNNLVNLEIDISGLYQLAAPFTPETARSEIIKCAEGGEKISAGEL